MTTQFIKSIKEYVSLSSEDEAYIMRAFKVRHLRRKEMLLQQGNVCQFAAFIVKGLLRMYHADSQDNQCVLKFATENNWALDLGSFVGNQASMLTIEAMEPTQVLYIDNEGMEALFQQSPAFECYIRLMQQRTLAALQQRLLSFMSQRADQRYAQFIDTHSALLQRLPQKHIASYLGISPEFLSKLRGQMSRGTFHRYPPLEIAQAA